MNIINLFEFLTEYNHMINLYDLMIRTEYPVGNPLHWISIHDSRYTHNTFEGNYAREKSWNYGKFLRKSFNRLKTI